MPRVDVSVTTRGGGIVDSRGPQSRNPPPAARTMGSRAARARHRRRLAASGAGGATPDPPRCPAAPLSRPPCTAGGVRDPCEGSAGSAARDHVGPSTRGRAEALAGRGGFSPAFPLRRPLKCTSARDHLVQHRAEREDVGARVHAPARGLLGCHVAGGAADAARDEPRPTPSPRGSFPGARAFRRFGQLCQAEVEHLPTPSAATTTLAGLRPPGGRCPRRARA